MSLHGSTASSWLSNRLILIYGAMREAKERRARLDDTSLTCTLVTIQSKSRKSFFRIAMKRKWKLFPIQIIEGAKDWPHQVPNQIRQQRSQIYVSRLQRLVVARQRCPGGLQKSWKERTMMNANDMSVPFGGSRRVYRDNGTKLWDPVGA